MSRKRRKIQLELAFTWGAEGEARSEPMEGIELPMAESEPERTIENERMMEEVCEKKNVKQAFRRVKSNRGAPGIDGMTVDQLRGHLNENWPQIRAELLEGTWRPKPVKRVKLPKPDGGTRNIGIPTVEDRFVQQAIAQVLQKRWEPKFSDQSYGFRPRRNAHQAIRQAQKYVQEGYRVMVDIDLEKFFDQVNHDRLMARIAEETDDKRILRILRRLLQCGVMEQGLVSPTIKGTPQGGPLSPLLSNIVLDELDKELERRGHRFVRYADDCKIYVRTRRAAERVMQSVRKFIEKRLRLRVNEAKSAVGRPQERVFLGFTLTSEKRRRIAEKSIKRFRARIRHLTRRRIRVRIEQVIREVTAYLTGWIGYFGIAEARNIIRKLDEWVRHRLRAMIWHGLKTPKKRRQHLLSLGVELKLARKVGGSSVGIWPISGWYVLGTAMPPSYFDSLGLRRLLSNPMVQANRRVRTRTHGGVGGRKP